MKNIAFVYTEYQQNVLFAICLQENITIDILFIRNNIDLQKNAKNFVDEVVYFDDIPFSWRSIPKYIDEYKRVVAQKLKNDTDYLICTWSVEHPIVRLALNHLKINKLYLFEDGGGSYIKRGYFNFNFGIKGLLLTALIDFAMDIYSFNLRFFDKKRFVGWSLYGDCFPDFKIDKKIIDSYYFQKAMTDGIETQETINLSKNAVVFIQQPYVEMTVLSEEEYIDVITQAVGKIKKHIAKNDTKIIWKLHPRTNRDEEKRRLDQIKTDLNFEIVQERWNMEHLAYMNRDNTIQYFSLGSSSLYVIFKLLPESNLIYLIKNDILIKKLAAQSQLNNLYQHIGIKII